MCECICAWCLYICIFYVNGVSLCMRCMYVCVHVHGVYSCVYLMAHEIKKTKILEAEATVQITHTINKMKRVCAVYVCVCVCAWCLYVCVFVVNGVSFDSLICAMTHGYVP